MDYVSNMFLVGSMRDRVGQLGESREYQMGRSESGMLSYSELQMWYPLLVSIKDRVGWALLQQAMIMYWHIWDLWGPAILVASTVSELDDTLPRFTDVQWDSVQATHGLPIEVFA
jgi:hypothetical protein